MADDELLGFFLNEKPCRALFAVQNLEDEHAYTSNISQYIDTTYAHTIDVLDKLEELGLTEAEKDGRRKLHSITEKGSEFAEKLRPLVRNSWEGHATVEMEMKEQPEDQVEDDEGGA